jgi:hypothetical protein
MIATLGVLIGVVGFEGLVALMDAKASHDLKPKNNSCRFFTPIFGFISFLILFILWILAGALIILVTVMADVCIDPTTNIETLALSSQPDFVWFLRCHEDGFTDPFPFQSQIDAVNGSFINATASFTDLQDEINGTPGCDSDPDCQRLNNTITDGLALLSDIQDAVGLGDSDVPGVLGNFGCDAINSRYQRVLILMCGTFTEALGLSTGVILAFAVIYFLSHCFTRLASDIGSSDAKVHPV